LDITGNTHRSEFCIDKLLRGWQRQWPSGFIRIRGFEELPPHPHMSLVQMLLMRCLVARFWKEPYKKTIGSLGHQLHEQSSFYAAFGLRRIKKWSKI